MKLSFKGKSAVITGASGGMGLEISKKLSENNISVLMLDLQSPSKDFLLKNKNCQFKKVDVTNFKKLNMKKTLFLSVLFVLATFIGSAQKSAVVDTEYILEKMPDYASAQSKLNNLSTQWENQVNSMIQEVESLYKNYQADKVIMSENMRTKREEEIADKERAIAQFRKDKFSKEVKVLQAELNQFPRALQAVILNQYRRKKFQL